MISQGIDSGKLPKSPIVAKRVPVGGFRLQNFISSSQQAVSAKDKVRFSHNPKIVKALSIYQRCVKVAQDLRASQGLADCLDTVTSDKRKKAVSRLESRYLPKINSLILQIQNINYKNQSGLALLHYAARWGHTDTLKTLLTKKGLDLEIKNPEGQTPLFLAVKDNNLETTQLLLDHGANVNVQDRDGDTPLLQAAHHGNQALLQTLFQFGPDIVKDNNIESTRLFLAHGANVNVEDRDGNTPLMQAVCHGNKDLVELLVQHGGDIHHKDLQNTTLLMRAAAVENGEDVVKYLLEKGLRVDDKDSKGMTPFLWAAAYNPNPAVIKQLLAHGSDITAHTNTFNTALGLAAKVGHRAVVELLLQDARINLEEPNLQGETALMLAVKAGHNAMVELLIKHGADPDVLGGFETPLTWAVKNNKPERVALLLKHGADPNVEEQYGHHAFNALTWAIIRGRKGIVEQLLNKGASLDAPQNFDYNLTPLMWSLYQGDAGITKLLLNHGAVFDDENEAENALLMKVCSEAALRFKIEARNFTGDEFRALPDVKLNNFEAVQRDLKKFYKKIFQCLVEHEVGLTGKIKYGKALETLISQNKRLAQQVQVEYEISKSLGIAMDDLTNRLKERVKNKDESILLNYLPQFLFSLPLSTVQGMARALESRMDNDGWSRGWHPNEAEFMLFLRHPENLERDEKKTAPITKALTSITRFRQQIPDTVVKAWSDIGLLTHGFRFWRYDALYKEASLFCKFGFEALEKDKFGQGFLFNPTQPGNDLTSLDPKTAIVFRRGYLLVSHPEHGTLVIRNSSKVFGRDLMEHPAHYSPKVYSAEKLKTYNPEGDNSLRHILTPELYRKPEFEPDLVFLTDELVKLKEDYRRWKLDTKAFEVQGGRKVFTGHQSPGLKPIFDFIDYLSDFTEGPLPDLAFTHPDYPPFEPYTFKDRSGKVQNRFKITPQRLRELRDVVNKTWSVTKYPHSDWVRFLNQAGVQNRGELVLLAPETDAPAT